MKILKVVVLLLSIAGGSLVVWNATRDKGANNKDEISSKEMIGSSKSKMTGLDLHGFDSDYLQASPKSGPIMDPEDVAEIVEDEPSEITVTDEEVKKMRESMLSTSKSGRIMSDDKIREMLEGQKREKAKAKAQAIPEQNLLRSSKSFSGSIIEGAELKKIIEGEKQDPSDLDELPPQE